MIWHRTDRLLFRKLQQYTPDGDKGCEKFFEFMNMLYNFTRHIDKHGECKSVLASESGKFLYILCNIFKISTIQNPYCF